MPIQSKSNPHETFMRRALALARRGVGLTSPNPAVGAVLVQRGKLIGEGWHRRAGQPHAEVEAVRDAESQGHSVRGATLYVTLEPCSTHGLTPPCTDLILKSGIKRVVVGATDPNPAHAGRAFELLAQKGVQVVSGVLEAEARELNAAFNHWIIHRTPLVTVKAAMTLDGKIATARGESQWITGEKSRQFAMGLRRASDALLVGVNTILADNPGLSVRTAGGKLSRTHHLRRIILDSRARTPAAARVIADELAARTTMVVGRRVSRAACERWGESQVRVMAVPLIRNRINLGVLLKKLGEEHVTSLLVEGGGEVNASFLEQGLAQRIAFFYAPKILGGHDSRKAVAGRGARTLAELIRLEDTRWRRLGEDLLLTARVVNPNAPE